MSTSTTTIIGLAHLSLILTIISIIVINLTAFIFWKYREFVIFRFRWPLSYILWSMCCNLYFISRIGFIFSDPSIFGKSYSMKQDQAWYSLRAIGLNGSYMILLNRIWLFYYTYQYDKQLLEFRTRDNSFIIKYHHKLGNEHFMLYAIIIPIWFILSLFVVLEETLLQKEFDGFTQIYFGMNFICFIILAFFIPRKHDQLGIFYETILYFLLSLIGLIGFLIIAFTLENTQKHIMSYLGATLMFFAVNLISAYISIIKYGGYKYISSNYNNNNNDNDKALKAINQNYIELAKIITHPRTYDTFRKFLADIFCVENLDFVTIVQYYRQFVENGSIITNTLNLDDEKDEKDGNNSPQFIENSPSFGSISVTKKISFTNRERRTRNKTQDQIISGLIVEDTENGSKIIDIKKLDMNHVKDIKKELEKLKDIQSWIHWIFIHYITNESDHCLNLPSKMRKLYNNQYEKIMDQFEKKDEKNFTITVVKSTTMESDNGDPSTTNNKDEDDNIELISFFDCAQFEIWKLMAQDSLTHFRNSDIYSQIMWQKSDNNNTDNH